MLSDHGASPRWRLIRLVSSLRSLTGRPRYPNAVADSLVAERQRRLVLTALTSAFARGIAVLSSFITVPLALNYLGIEQYGIWVTLSSFALLLSFADLGIGNGVVGAVARHLGQGDFVGIRQCVATAYAVLFVVALVIGAAFLIAYPLVSWAHVFNVKSGRAVAQAGPAAAVFFLAFVVAIPANVIQRLQSGLQEGFRLNLWTMSANIASLLCLLLCIKLRLSLSVLVFVLFFTPILFNGLNAADTFFRRVPESRPRLGDIDRSLLREIMSSGAMFFVLQISASVIFASNPFFIAQMIGASAVTGFGVVDRLSSVVIVVLQMLLLPLWPAYGEAKARHDWRWIEFALKVSVAISLGLSIASGAVLLLLGPAILRLWINHAFSVPYSLIAAFALWRVFEAFGAAMATYMNGLHELTAQAIAGVATAIASVLLKFWLVPAFGVTGAVSSMILAYVVFAMPMNFYVLRKSRTVRTAPA